MATPKLLFLDEPSLGRAPFLVQEIFEIIRKINTENRTTIFLVEQNANLALKVSMGTFPGNDVTNAVMDLREV